MTTSRSSTNTSSITISFAPLQYETGEHGGVPPTLLVVVPMWSKDLFLIFITFGFLLYY